MFGGCGECGAFALVCSFFWLLMLQDGRLSTERLWSEVTTYMRGIATCKTRYGSGFRAVLYVVCV